LLDKQFDFLLTASSPVEVKFAHELLTELHTTTRITKRI